MITYWLTPPRWHIIAWAVARWPEDRAKFRRMRLKQLRAIWHNTNKGR